MSYSENDIKRAIKNTTILLDNVNKSNTYLIADDDTEWLHIVINLLKKQFPKKPKYSEYESTTICKCVCGFIVYPDENFCKHCGQRLK